MFTPITDYSGYQHVLGANAMCVHPGNGNIYLSVIEQHNGVHQDLSIYRLPAGTSVWQLVYRYYGAIDAESQIAFGSMVIGKGGNMIVAMVLVPKNTPHVTTTGFQAVWTRELAVDAPW